jgi:MerR family redox-sensitive transcriptional activator SoxR
MTIGELAQRTGLRTSALRYYEELGLLGRVERAAGGRRVYGPAAADRLTFITAARRLGFTLRDVRELIGGFPARRWRPLAERRLAELEELARRIEVVRAALRRALRCDCLDVEACGRKLRG